MSVLAAAPSLAVKKAAAVAWVQSLLAAHDADFGRDGAVLAYRARAAVRSRSRADRLAVMAANYAGAGETPDYGPERFAFIEHVREDARAVEPLFSGEPLDAGAVCDLHVYWGFREDDDWEAEDAAFDAALLSRDPDRRGLVVGLRTDPAYYVHTDDDGVTWEIVARGVAITDRGLFLVDEKNGEYRFAATVTLTLTGAPT